MKAKNILLWLNVGDLICFVNYKTFVEGICYAVTIEDINTWQWKWEIFIKMGHFLSCPYSESCAILHSVFPGVKYFSYFLLFIFLQIQLVLGSESSIAVGWQKREEKMSAAGELKVCPNLHLSLAQSFIPEFWR